jgi:NADH dehydrogenase
VSQALVLGPGRKLHIFGKWTWGVFFPTDLTHRRFPGSHALIRAQRGGLADVAATATPLRG